MFSLLGVTSGLGNGFSMMAGIACHSLSYSGLSAEYVSPCQVQPFVAPLLCCVVVVDGSFLAFASGLEMNVLFWV